MLKFVRRLRTLFTSLCVAIFCRWVNRLFVRNSGIPITKSFPVLFIVRLVIVSGGLGDRFILFICVCFVSMFHVECGASFFYCN